MEPVIDTIKVISVVDSSFMSSIDGLVESSFTGGVELALVACVFGAAIVLLGTSIHRAVGGP